MKEWWKKHKDNVLVAVLVLYVISLAVVTVDTIFGPWLFPPELDRQISEQIEKLKSDDPAAPGEAIQDLINDKGDFAVPALIKLLKNPDIATQTRINAVTALSRITEQSLGNDPATWIRWFEQNRHLFP